MLKTTLAGLLARKLRLLLTAVAITLGVGFIAGTFVMTDTMQKGVQETFEQSAGKVDAAVLPKRASDVDGLPANLLARVRGVPGVKDAHGLVHGDAALVGRNGKAIGQSPTVGMSVPKGPLLRYALDEGRAPGGPSEVVLDSRTAEKEKFAVGERVTVLDSKRAPHPFTVVGLVDFGIDQEASFRGAVGFDQATAMRMTGLGTYAEIDVLGADPAAVAAAVGGSYEVLGGEELGARLASEAGTDTKMIQTGLLIFGLVAMLVSALVIYNTFSILVAQRMREMALLRCVGATRRQVFGGVLAESFVVGVVGSLLGLLLGLGLGAGAMALFNALGANMPMEGVALTPRTIVVGLAVGITVTVLSALLPARAATRVAPVAALRTDTEPGGGRFRLGWVRIVLAAAFTVFGVLIGGAGTMAEEKGDFSMFAVAGAGALVFLAVIALMPALIRPFGRVAGAIPARLGGVPGRLAVENARRSPRRTATTTIALTVGVGLMTLFAVVGATSKATTDQQLKTQFPVDFQMQSQFTSGDGERLMPHALVQRLEAKPELGDVMAVRESEARLAGEDMTVSTIGGPPVGAVLKPTFVAGSAAALKPGTAIVDEDAAKQQGLTVGRQVQVETGRGKTMPVRIAGIFTDAPFSGLVITGADFDRHFAVRDAASIFVVAAEGASATAARAVVDEAARPFPTVQVLSSAELKEEYTQAIDMVLMIFAGLLGLAIIIALFGIANTLTLSVVERTRESALLRALGLTKRQLRRMLSVEALVMAVIGAFTGVLLGLVFGWAAGRAMAESTVFAVPYLQIAGFIVLAGIAGMLAAVLPARRAAKASIVDSISSG